MTHLVEQARAGGAAYFNASPDEYAVIFTPNATGALKLVGESYPFGPGDTYLLTFDNHNSVNGIREFARARGATVTYIPIVPPDLRVDADLLSAGPGGAPPWRAQPVRLPGPIQLHRRAASPGVDRAWPRPRAGTCCWTRPRLRPATGWTSAAGSPTSSTSRSTRSLATPPARGCLLVRRAALHKLRRPWYAGGTITFSSVVGDGHYLTPGPAGFEDGTVNYLSLPAVEIGLRYIESIGIETIHTRVTCLTGWLIEQLLGLRHSNGRPLIQLYGPPNTYRRGGTVQVNFFDPDGQMIDCTDVERLANERRISLRAGCHCNPGAREVALGFTRDELAVCFQDKAERRPSSSSCRSSTARRPARCGRRLGLASNFADVYAYVQFAGGFIDQQRPQ